MLPLALLVPLALASLNLVVPWPSASGVGLLPMLVPSDWAPGAVMSRRLGAEEDFEKQLEVMEKEFGYEPGSSGSDSDSDNLIVAFLGTYVVLMVAAFLTPIVICVSQLIFACQYKEKVTERRPPLQDGSASCTPTNDFSTGPFSCFEHTPTCMHAWCCMFCRAADTYQGAGIEQYWSVVFYFIGAGFVGNFVGSIVNFITNFLFSSVSSAGPDSSTAAGAKAPTANPLIFLGQIVSLLVYGGILQRFRRKLRTRLGGREEGGPGIFMDVCLYGFCTCCVVAQEARELDTATGVQVECCCKLNSANTGQPLYVQPLVGGQPQPLVGQPVYGNVA